MVIVGVVACDQSDERASSAQTTDVPAASAALPADLVLPAPPAAAPSDVATVRDSVKAGDTVVVRGVVGGRVEPISPNRAIFTLLDSSIETCDKMKDYACDTPWDACCEPADVIAANSLTVQVVDAEGNPLKAGLSGVGNLAPLKQVTVVGTFKPSPDGAAATVNATGLIAAP
jgi:hypothetical protein